MWGQVLAAIIAAVTPSITIVSTGDVMTARSINVRSVKTGDFVYPFGELGSIFRTADVVFINLETPLVPKCPVTSEGMVFCADPRSARALKDVGVTDVGIANNHIRNFGNNGLGATRVLLKSYGLNAVSDEVSYRTIKGQKIAFLAFDAVGKTVKATEKISAARKTADLVIVQYHWGEEYKPSPNSGQKKLAHEAVDAGADLVLGNHPHWIQPTEVYKDKLIVYSHGNTVFDQYWSEKTREGIIGKYVFQDGKMTGSEFIKTYTTTEGKTVIRK